jgi:hypothetical protein
VTEEEDCPITRLDLGRDPAVRGWNDPKWKDPR